VCAGVGQIYSVYMKDRKMNGVQLYYNIGPLSAALMLGGGLVVDTYLQRGVSILAIHLPPNVLVGRPSPPALPQPHACPAPRVADLLVMLQMWILLSCALAAPMNFSSAMMLAKTSAVTYAPPTPHPRTACLGRHGPLTIRCTRVAAQVPGGRA
jgi:hypothetical protein